jgi:O-antigen/teichoic acid export membrane protein
MLSLISPSVASALTAEGAHDPEQLWHVAARSQKTIMAMLLPTCVLLALSGHWILLAFGSEYAAEGFMLLLLFVVAAPLDSVMDVWVAVLRVEGRLRFGSWLQLGTAGLALVLAWFLLPPLGIAGAGIGWLVSRIVGVALVAWDYNSQKRLRASRGPSSGRDSTGGSTAPDQSPMPA